MPFVFLVLLGEQLLRRAILYFIPPARVGHSPAFAINLTLLILTLAGLGLSVWNRKGSVEGASAGSPMTEGKSS